MGTHALLLHRLRCRPDEYKVVDEPLLRIVATKEAAARDPGDRVLRRRKASDTLMRTLGYMLAGIILGLLTLLIFGPRIHAWFDKRGL